VPVQAQIGSYRLVAHVVRPGSGGTLLGRRARLVKKPPNFLASGISRPAGQAQSIPHFFGGGGEQFRFEGVE
jgi:hypothetical protein